MPVVGIEHADADAHAERRRGARGCRRQHAAIERVLGEPYGVKAVRLGDGGEVDGTAGIDPAGQTHAQFRQLGHSYSSRFQSSPRGAPRDARVAGTPLREPIFQRPVVMGFPSISAFTRVHSPSKTGVNAQNDALCAGTTAKVLVETAHHTPPGRSPELASEKCACTTRQPPASLRNTMVERVMNSSPP